MPRSNNLLAIFVSNGVWLILSFHLTELKRCFTDNYLKEVIRLLSYCLKYFFSHSHNSMTLFSKTILTHYLRYDTILQDQDTMLQDQKYPVLLLCLYSTPMRMMQRALASAPNTFSTEVEQNTPTTNRSRSRSNNNKHHHHHHQQQQLDPFHPSSS